MHPSKSLYSAWVEGQHNWTRLKKARIGSTSTKPTALKGDPHARCVLCMLLVEIKISDVHVTKIVASNSN